MLICTAVLCLQAFVITSHSSSQNTATSCSLRETIKSHICMYLKGSSREFIFYLLQVIVQTINISAPDVETVVFCQLCAAGLSLRHCLKGSTGSSDLLFTCSCFHSVSLVHWMLFQGLLQGPLAWLRRPVLPLGESPLTVYIWLFRPTVARRCSSKLEMVNTQTHATLMCTHSTISDADEHLERYLLLLVCQRKLCLKTV